MTEDQIDTETKAPSDKQVRRALFDLKMVSNKMKLEIVHSHGLEEPPTEETLRALSSAQVSAIIRAVAAAQPAAFHLGWFMAVAARLHQHAHSASTLESMIQTTRQTPARSLDKILGKVQMAVQKLQRQPYNTKEEAEYSTSLRTHFDEARVRWAQSIEDHVPTHFSAQEKLQWWKGYCLADSLLKRLRRQAATSI